MRSNQIREAFLITLSCPDLSEAAVVDRRPSLAVLFFSLVYGSFRPAGGTSLFIHVYLLVLHKVRFWVRCDFKFRATT